MEENRRHTKKSEASDQKSGDITGGKSEASEKSEDNRRIIGGKEEASEKEDGDRLRFNGTHSVRPFEIKPLFHRLNGLNGLYRTIL